MSPLRFHTATAIGSKVFVFGGCHGTYLLHNELYEIDLSVFLKQEKSSRETS